MLYEYKNTVTNETYTLTQTWEEKKQYLIGHKIKYNINDKLFFMPENIHDLDIYKLYDYKSYLDKGYSIDGLPCFVLYKNKFYEST